MGKISRDSLLEQLRWRYSVKRFDKNRRIAEEDWGALEDALLLAPSSYGLQPWRFYVVDCPEKRERLKALSWNQPQVTECSHLVVIAARKGANEEDIDRYLKRIQEIRGTPADDLEMLRGMISASFDTAREENRLDEWAARQCYLALGFLLESAAVMGIDACPMEGFEPNGYDQELGIKEEGYASVLVCALGYRDSENDKLAQMSKVRFEKSEVIKRR